MKLENKKLLLEQFKLKRYWCNKNGDIFSACRNKVIKIKPATFNGYKICVIAARDKKLNLRVHSVVWMYFNGFYRAGLEINHKDGNKLNNKISNLELVTHSENMRHAYLNGLNKGATGELSNTAKLTKKQVCKIRRLYKSGNYTYKEIGIKFNVSLQNIFYITKNISWKHI